MGLKRRSRFAMAACMLGANAPDIDVFAPLFLPVQGIEFHRGPLHGVFAWPLLAAAIVAILWLLNRFRPGGPDTLPFRPAALFGVTFLAVLTHPFLDWLTTYAIALFSPVSWRWYSGDAIFIVDWVYLLLMVAGITWSALRSRKGATHAGRPAQIAGVIMLAYISFNLGESRRVEQAAADQLQSRGIDATLVVASPPPLAFWRRGIAWRSADRFGTGSFDFAQGLRLDPGDEALNLDDSRLARARADDEHVRAFLIWSRMPVVVIEGGKAFLTDQRFYSVRASPFAQTMRRMVRRSAFLIPLDNPHPSS